MQRLRFIEGLGGTALLAGCSAASGVHATSPIPASASSLSSEQFQQIIDMYVHQPHNPPVQVSKAWFHFSPPSTPSATYLSKNGGEKGFSSWIGFNQWVDTSSPSQYGAFALANVKHGADIVGKAIIDLLLA